MTAALKRLAFVVGFLPLSLYAFARWIVTGSNPLEVLDRAEEWRDE